MDIITLCPENIEKEHVCCAISNNNDCQVASKKKWLSERFADGLVFKKCDVRGKCFIEYIPAEAAWAPIDAMGFMYIDCLWVSGQFKGHGYSNLLLDECIRDSRDRNMAGLVALSSKKKLGFLSDPAYLAHRGFVTVDSAAPHFTLMYLPFSDSAQKPRFRECVKAPEGSSGFVLYYTHQCPYTAKYVPIIESIANERGVPFKSVLLDSRTAAQNAPSPFTTYTLFYDGAFVTHEILSDKKFEKILVDRGY